MRYIDLSDSIDLQRDIMAKLSQQHNLLWSMVVFGFIRMRMDYRLPIDEMHVGK